jgi:hypothetical protein
MTIKNSSALIITSGKNICMDWFNYPQLYENLGNRNEMEHLPFMNGGKSAKMKDVFIIGKRRSP